MRNKFIVFGKKGQVGTELSQQLGRLGDVQTFSREECDITDRASVEKIIHSEKPTAIINAAAYTKVDLAEDETEQCYAINAKAVGNIAECCVQHGVFLVHYSTDYVFDGSSSRPWQESDLTQPLGVYGASKLQGEKEIIASGCAHVILRTSWVYSLTGQNFLLTILRLAEQREQLSIVCDQIGAPTWSRSIAEKTTELLSYLMNENKLLDVKGLYHFSAKGETNWHAFASKIVEFAQSKRDLKITNPQKQIVPIASSEYPQKAKRPMYSVLDTTKLEKDFTVVMPDWLDALKACMEEL